LEKKPLTLQIGGVIITLLMKTQKMSYEDESIKEDNFKEVTELECKNSAENREEFRQKLID